MDKDNYRFFCSVRKTTSDKIVGADEVGRGALAGPILVVALVIDDFIPEIDDSKKIARQKREKLAALILRSARKIGLGWTDPREIDRLGLSRAQALAYDRALATIPKDFLVLTDDIRLEDRKFVKAVRGDGLFYPVSAASIVAKVLRDQLMRSYHQFHPSYLWQDNVGYGTAGHLEAIRKHGLTALHRRSFIRGDKKP